MNKTIVVILVLLMLLTAGCQGTDVRGDDYQDAPSQVKDGSLDYQDYKEVDCPYLEDSLDQQTMEKCNQWVRENSDS